MYDTIFFSRPPAAETNYPENELVVSGRYSCQPHVPGGPLGSRALLWALAVGTVAGGSLWAGGQGC
jgi:hypothetical protein